MYSDDGLVDSGSVSIMRSCPFKYFLHPGKSQTHTPEGRKERRRERGGRVFGMRGDFDPPESECCMCTRVCMRVHPSMLWGSSAV